jgi:hypothetical protein
VCVTWRQLIKDGNKKSFEVSSVQEKVKEAEEPKARVEEEGL